MEKRKWIVRAVSIVLAALIIGTLAVPLANLAYAEDGETPAEKLERIQEEIDNVNALIEANKNDASKAQQMSDYYKQQQNAILAKINVLKEDINQRREDLTVKQDELAAQVQEVQDAQDLLSERLRAMYEMQRTNPLSFLLGLNSLSEMLRFSENLRTITVSNDEAINNLKAEKDLLQQQADAIQGDLDTLNAQETELETSKNELQAAIQNADKMVSEAQAAAQAQEAALADLQKQYQQAEDEWKAWVASNADQNYITDNGEFMWPIPGYYRISSDFGTVRVIYGVTDVHRGMDVPAPAGTPIYAAAAGVVSTNAHWTYGTCVKISHTPSMVTIYGHMSARAAGITDGVVVNKGDLIGYVGSTGNSTGNHLHFELDINGKPTSSRPYLDPNIVSQLHW